MKKCKRCEEQKKEYSRNSRSIDGLNSVCKTCTNEMTNDRRRRLVVMLKRVDPSLEVAFTDLHDTWIESGFDPGLKPVVIAGECMTRDQGKGNKIERLRTTVEMLDDQGGKIKTFLSIAHAVRETGDNRAYIKWSSLNDVGFNGKNRWKIKKD